MEHITLCVKKYVFINNIKTNIIIFITRMMIKCLLSKEANKVFDSLSFFLGLRN